KALAIIEIPEELKDKQEVIAKAIMKLHKNVKTVLKKASERKGKLRIREYELIAGDTNTEVIHKEYGYLLKLDPQKVYFSPREATERQRIAEQVKSGEKVLVMFSGVCPYPLAIFKKQPRVNKIVAVEINPEAHKYAEENVKLNKAEKKIFPILGDVKEVCPKYYGEFDRVVMPLPLGAESFLDIAIKCLKQEGGIIHFYNWGSEDDLYSRALDLIEKSAKKLKKKVEILDKRKVLPYAPKKYKVCIDFKVV
ncbi:MAG: class I SAM-dependent methyltransferase family protein, partial [Candidatus Aenigmarchaeota archaeon]|nr:class I SAM-dependent methyltransferase family protein [Candidatus Aenigmarchaeota archaeon]